MKRVEFRFILFVFQGCWRVDAVWACARGWLWCGTLYHCPSCCWPLGSTCKMWTTVRGDYYNRKNGDQGFFLRSFGWGIWYLGSCNVVVCFWVWPLADRDQLLSSYSKPASCTLYSEGLNAGWKIMDFELLSSCSKPACYEDVHHTLRGWMLVERLWNRRHFWKTNQGCGIMKRLCQITTWWFQKISQSCRIMRWFLEDE